MSDPTSPLAGKVVAVTGAGSGIGLATAAAVCALGASVLLTGRTVEKLNTAAASLGGPTSVLALDVSAADAGPRLVAAAVEAFGRLDVLVANAGVYVPGDLWDGAPADFANLISTNVTGVITTVQAAVTAMRDAGHGGDIVVTSSVSGHQAIHWEPVYSASKHAVQAFVHGVRRQLIGSDIRIGAIAPGVVLNDLWQVTGPAEIENKVAAGTGIRSEDVADAIVFMLTRPRHIGIRDLVILPVNQEI
ncbi:ribitol 2-dehydrogenase [Nakamurella panacisegetis]|uniref:Ribitol 2-dehydrogenase n=1 Tax=Nakamurella panacisegetis TaxID=1090615 RepID=A0A1H0TAA7_9ACTN|nr:SDR family oxidoreductase [Nakamurella panacisegetis]SDP50446.1 ribitol 2-dehydrogenase [Nakamurella panacisegetis]